MPNNGCNLTRGTTCSPYDEPQKARRQIKVELQSLWRFSSTQKAQAIWQSIKMYNYERPHESPNYPAPADVYFAVDMSVL